MILVIYTFTHTMKATNPKVNYFFAFVLCSILRLLYRCVCKYLLQNNIHVSEVHCGSAVRFGQALPGFLITAHHLCTSLM